MSDVNASDNNKNAISTKEYENICSTVSSVYDQLQAVEKFVARRFDELSMEINATSQQVDMAEDGIGKRFSEILEVLSAISYSGGGTSAANSGVELEAVIQDTEGAANTILDAAERISELVDDTLDWSDQSVRDDVRSKIANDVQEILMACTFQDLTGQRIRNTLNNLQDIEERLNSTFERLGINVKPSEQAVSNHVHQASSQNEIDALLKGYEAAENLKAPEGENTAPNQTSSQDDIDGMFD